MLRSGRESSSGKDMLDAWGARVAYGMVTPSYSKSKAGSGGGIDATLGEYDRCDAERALLAVRWGPGPGLEEQEVGWMKYVWEYGYGPDSCARSKWGSDMERR